MSRARYDQIRQRYICDLRRDLIGPAFGENESLREPPVVKYMTGILHPNHRDDEDEIDDGENPAFMAVDGGEAGEEAEDIENVEENEVLAADEEADEGEVVNKKYQLQSSLGISFYLGNTRPQINIVVRWGKYSEKQHEVEGYTYWERETREQPFSVNIVDIESGHRIPVEGNIFLKIIKRNIRDTENLLVTLFVVNGNRSSIENIMFQTELEISSMDGSGIFLCENLARHNTGRFDEFIYRNKPVFGRGLGCAVSWHEYNSERACRIRSEFIPETEIPSVSTELEDMEGMEQGFSTKAFSDHTKRAETITTLSALANAYDRWIGRINTDEVQDTESAQETVNNCRQVLERIRAGITLLEENDTIFEAFMFANKVMNMQLAMKVYSKNRDLSLDEYYDRVLFSWRPFQIAFFLVNLTGIVDPYSNDRQIVDLLWFPTGGGKTEAYLGIAAFLMAYRRLTAGEGLAYEKDGGVTIILRYTLRLLTTQQRDRLLKMICAAEIQRTREPAGKFGHSRFTIGFWVGGQVTANKFSQLEESEFYNASQVEKARNNLRSQVIECPCCGNNQLRYQFNLDVDDKNFSIFCTNEDCHFSNTGANPQKLPVYLVDEEIYRRFPTVLISTVDKFARLPWDEKTSMLFGNCDRFCERHGYLMPSETHSASHRATDTLPRTVVRNVRPFHPPELIIQDELHLITGPLGTIYAGYETAIEHLCKAENGERVSLPKYIVSTATIKNAGNQIEKLYAREQHCIFPPPGLTVENSFFAREIDTRDYPFRKYVGICAPGFSMKTVALRIYALLLQTGEGLRHDTTYSDYLDPYWTIIGYFNSVRELGGMVRLLDDDVKERIKYLQRLYGYPSERRIYKKEELTSRQPSYRIPQILKDLERTVGNWAYDVVLATNMIAVGMDVDRLGLMIVTGQPKATSEYIQATSRVGRKLPGLVITIYNPYRPRDISHYENFTGYHQRLYSHVEGTTATPFAARARDRFLHAIVVSLLRLGYTQFAKTSDADNITTITPDILNELRDVIRDRVGLIDPGNQADTLLDMTYFLDQWNQLANRPEDLWYYYSKAVRWNAGRSENRLLCDFTEIPTVEKPTLNSMRGVENASQFNYYEAE